MSALPAILGGTPAFPDGLPLVRPWLPEADRLASALSAVLASGQLTNGPVVRRLEEAVAERLGVEHVVAVSSCTVGLTLVYRCLDVRGDVVLPSFTFSASAHAVHWAGGTPVWADVEPERLTLDVAGASRAVDGRTCAISATHIYGAPCAVEDLQDLAAAAGVPLVLDAAHALGSSRRGVPVGRFGTAEVFSLSPTKVLVGGEGGLVATRDGDLADKLRLAREYGNPGDYDCRFPGLNGRMSELHAATALHNLAHLDAAVARRNALVDRFRRSVSGARGLRLQHVDPGDTSTYKDLTVLVDPQTSGIDVVTLAEALRAEGVDTRRYYYPPIHRQEAYRHLHAAPLPVTDAAASSALTLPLWTHMSDDQLDRLADVLLRVLAHAPRVSGTAALAS